jgi:hypothetical protein
MTKLEATILGVLDSNWTKVARIAGVVLALGVINEDNDFESTFNACLTELIVAGHLEADGNIANWRVSEVRVPRTRH